MADTKRNFVVVVGFQTDLDVPRTRGLLRNEFSKVGQVTKLYLKENFEFAKVYFESLEICKRAVREFNQNDFGWTVSITSEPNFTNQNRALSDFSSRNSDHSNEITHRENFSSNNNKNEMEDGYLEDEFSENFDYCNVHGQPLTVFEGDTGDLYINLKDIKKTGFALFRRDTFNSILLDKQQIHQEFELHLLSEAKNYILKNRVSCIDEDQILKTIERCKERLLNKPTASRNDQQPMSRTIHQSQNSDNFFAENNNRNKRDSFYNRADNQTRPRPPKTPANSFMPSSAYSNHATENRNRNNDNRNFDGGNFTTPFPGRGSNKPNFDGFDRGNSGRGDTNRTNQNRNNGAIKKDFNTGFDSEFNKDSLDGGNFSKGDANRNNRNNRNNGAFKKDFTSSTPQPKKSSDQMGKKSNGIPGSTILKDTVEIGNTYNVRVSYCEADRDNIYWVQKSESLKLVDDLLLDIADLEPTVDVVTHPVQGENVLAEFEGVWCRAEVITPSNKLVHFIDYGNQSVAESLKRIPDNVKNSPALAIRIVVNRNKLKLTDGEDISIKIIQKYEDGTYLVDISSEANNQNNEKTTEVPEPPQAISEKTEDVLKPCQTPKIEKVEEKTEPVNIQAVNTEPESSVTYHLNPKPLTSLKDGDKVMFVDRLGNKLAVKTKECVDKSKEIVSYIKELNKSALHLTSVSEGQLVLCTKEGCVGLCRAVVTEVNKNIITIKYVDYSGEDKIVMTYLRNADEFLAKQPAALILTPDLQYLENLSVGGVNFITELVGRKEKAVVVMTDNGIDFQLTSDVLLSQSLLEKSSNAMKKTVEPLPVEQTPQSVPIEKEKPLAEKEVSVSQSNTQVLYDDMDWIKMSPGEYEFICYYVKNSEDITLVSTLDESVQHMEKIADIEDPDKLPYKPDVFEMCLVYFVEDTEGFWYRGVVVDVEGEHYNVLMVDFGNETTVTCDKLRKFPAKLRNIPILGISCVFEGVPVSSKVTEKLKELIPQNENVTATIKGFNEETFKYLIDIPNVRKVLKDEGLC